MKNIKSKSKDRDIPYEEFVGYFEEDHLTDVLLPAVQKGDWESLEEMPVFREKDTGKQIMYSSNSWSLTEFGDGFQSERMLFNHSTKKSFDGYVLPTCFRNQIKCFAVWEMLSDSVPYGYANIVSTVSKLTDIAKTAIEIGLEGFHQLDIDSIFEMINEQCFIVNDKGNKTLSAINRLVQASSHISIAIPIHEKLKPETFNKVVTGSEQYPVIPHRPFLEMISTSSDEMQNAFKNIEALSEAIERYLQKTEDIKAEIIEKVRTGVVDLDDVIASDRNSMVTAIKKSFFEAGIAIADDYKADNQDWFKVWEEHKVTYQTSFASAETIEFTATIGNKRIRNRSEFNDYLRELQGYCCFLCCSLSGIRIGELWGVSTVYGAQNHIKVKGGTIYMFTTKQEKITLDSQTKDDIYVTSRAGFRAYQVLDAIHKPFRKRFKEGEHSSFFAALSEVYHPQSISKKGLGKAINSIINTIFADLLTLEPNDIDFLRASDPEKKYQIGERFSFTNHQCRRSFAYYLIGYELMDYPQLKQQLGHISMAMTKWYARNAWSFKKIYTEVQNMRNAKCSKLIARLYSKLANKERLAGGLGAGLVRDTMKDRNYFSKDENQRKLDATYWEEQIKTGKVHIHAIGQGMYCTKRTCAMRASIDLSECVGCAWDIIEDALTAESLRMTAMRNIILLLDCDELNSSSATKYLLDIRSAEQILRDLDFKHEAYEAPDELLAIMGGNQSVEVVNV
ncbi:site-specific integrase [Vibrio vulnificus]